MIANKKFWWVDLGGEPSSIPPEAIEFEAYFSVEDEGWFVTKNGPYKLSGIRLNIGGGVSATREGAIQYCINLLIRDKSILEQRLRILNSLLDEDTK